MHIIVNLKKEADMTRLWAKTALLADGWRENIGVEISETGVITAVRVDETLEEFRADERVDILLPAPSNLHSHAFQRAMAGLTERRGGAKFDSFWTWREVMYRFLGQLSPEDVEAVAAFVQMEMLEAGYGASAEFHYLHNQPGGAAYDDPAELSRRIAAGAKASGIGLTLLPVYYATGGVDGRALKGGQLRFKTDRDHYERILQGAEKALGGLAGDAVLGAAPHSLRAVSREDLTWAARLLPRRPLHMHIAEQVDEISEVEAIYGARPVDWLFDNHDVNDRWCLIHSTHMNAGEVLKMARSGAVVGLCPITESNLGDGIFDGENYLGAGGHIGVGSDSNVRISLSEELKTLEYSQRLRDRRRAVLATAERSVGRVLFESVCAGGARALGRDCGVIEEGKLADLTALDGGSVHLEGVRGDGVLDMWIFAGDDRLVSDVWSAGRRVVKGGSHVDHERITNRYRAVMARLRGSL